MFIDTHSVQAPAPLRRRLCAATCAWLLALTACGGGDPLAVEQSARSPTLIELDPVPALLADDGSVMPTDPGTVPEDAAARTNNARYASSRQAEQLEHALGTDVLAVDIPCCGSNAAESAIGLLRARQLAYVLPDSTPVLVHSADLRLGASVANRLLQRGYVNVWLVTR